MGHAYKLLLLVNDHVEVLHYTQQNYADDAFDQLAELSKEKKHKVAVTKLYSPKKNSRGWTD